MRSKGFTVIELLVSAALVSVVMSVSLVLVAQARDALDRDGLGVEAAQRLRTGLDVLLRDIRAAGAGPDVDPVAQPLAHAMPAIQLLPSLGSGSGDGAGVAALRVVSAPAGAAYGRLAEPIGGGNLLRFTAPPDCPGLDVCGFRAGATAVVYDGSGAFDVVQVTAIEPATRAITVAPSVSRPYAVGTLISEVVISTFELDAAGDGGRRLIRRTGAGAVQPIVDHVVAFHAEGLGDAEPPAPGRRVEWPPSYGPVPPLAAVDDSRDAWPAGENCTLTIGSDGVRSSRLAVLGPAGALIAVAPAQLQDGPWCPASAGGVHDADLYRLRRVDVRLRVEAAAARLRGPASTLFARAGHARAAAWVPDLELRLSIVPQNLGRR